MNDTGTHIYSVPALKQIVSEQGLMGIAGYIVNAPDSVRSIIFSWCSEDEVNQYISYEHHELNKRNESEMENVLEGQNPYQDMDFDKRLTIDRLLAYVNDTGICPDHETTLDNKQVVIQYGDHKKYGVLLPTCKTCKKIFISTFKYQDIEDILVEKEIPYRFIKDEPVVETEEILDETDDLEEVEILEDTISLENEEVDCTLEELLDRWVSEYESFEEVRPVWILNKNTIDENINEDDFEDSDADELQGSIGHDVKESDFNIYAGLNFMSKSAILLDEIVIYEREDSFCDVHKDKLIEKKFKVLGSTGLTQNFSAMCCTQCKRIFMKAIEFEKVAKIFDKKYIDYRWSPSGTGIDNEED